MQYKTPTDASSIYQELCLYIDRELIQNNGFPALERDDRITGEFPDDFIWATASSAYQVIIIKSPLV